MARQNSINDWIAAQANQLTEGEQRLAVHLSEQLELWAFESAGQLASRLGVHRSSIVRLAQKLGLSGFPELQATARDALIKSFSPSPELSLQRSPNNRAELVERIYEREQMNLRKTYEGLDVNELEATARAIAAAERVVFFGRRFSYPIALHLSMSLNTMRKDVRMAPELGGSATDPLFDLTSRDFVLIVSLRRHSPEVQRTVAFLNSLGVPQALLTDVSIWVDAPPKGIRLLRAFVGSHSVLDSYTALTSVSHALLSLISEHIAGSHERLEAVERAWNRFNRPI